MSASGHFGKTSVVATMLKQPGRTTATLRTRTGNDSYTTTSYANAYFYPIDDITGLDYKDGPTKRVTIVLYQLGETYAPGESDWIVDASSNLWLVMKVKSRCNKDSGFGVHDCVCVR